MKFSLGEKVKVKSTGRIGEIRQCRHDLLINHGVKKETRQYWINFGHYHTVWYEENEIDRVDNFSDDFEKGFIDLLIDVNLMMGNYDIVETLVNDKKKT